ncbi:phasin family protein [Paraburkholderia sp. DHOC27]|uniref:phasin family protein n=1 Tax=Paraburkholderia sp. DHOC27 TaxID=2303330 RepID=UPI000E3BAA3B|nr:phasin family protein [Paraburkholderia sp. DHOC27]RFU44375.1 phasin family protein [Paraburkholderia sp. DHOC27]
MSLDTIHESDSATGAAFACAVELIAAFEKTTALNLQALAAWLRGQHTVMDAMLSASSLAEVIELESLHRQATTRKVYAYWRRVEEIAVETCIGLLVPIPEAFGTIPGIVGGGD